MKKLILFLAAAVLIAAFFIIACQNSESNLGDQLIGAGGRITYRDEPACDCPDPDDPYCCCFVTFNETSGSLILQICGTTGNYGLLNIPCSMATGQDCYQIGGHGISVTLDPSNPTQTFCIPAGAPFSLYNMNGSGTVHITVGIKSPGALHYHTIGTQLNYSDGTYWQDYTTGDCDEITACAY